SLIAKGKPCSGPRRGATSAALASASSSSRGRSETMALMGGLRRSMRSRKAAMTSAQETSRAAMARERVSASSAVGSVMAQAGRQAAPATSLVHVGPDARVELADFRSAGLEEFARLLEL